MPKICEHKWMEWNTDKQQNFPHTCPLPELCPVCHHCKGHCPGHYGLRAHIRAVRGAIDVVSHPAQGSYEH
jgi:hypothetical protein